MDEDLLTVADERSLTAVAGTLRAIADQLERGDRLRLEGTDRQVAVPLPDSVAFEVGLELEGVDESEEEDGDETDRGSESEDSGEAGDEETHFELEIELEWPVTDADAAEVVSTAKSGEQVESTVKTDRIDAECPHEVVAIASPPESLAEFRLFEDRAGEWRWHLRHQNGNIIADSGEGYTSKQSARNGIRSVVRNAPGASVLEERPE
ncbi:HVO_2922 family protein [Natronosalvus rutilus]|uniref:YegP family protein n=1 Tax=Natronosalvus rutilus TaxID=2953753 RepID=A0A9E7NB36_9EURY|nr:HVO_2922 family protein [Natronosalvus rutilus]UTF54156.1 YegP family protein [Natronosalvus rutilus]